MNIDTLQRLPTIGFNRALDFCVWVLCKDGLKFPPFDLHSDGDGALRACGFDEGDWKRWVQDVAEALREKWAHQQGVDQVADEIQGRFKLDTQRLERLFPAVEVRRNAPIRAWTFVRGMTALGRYLLEGLSLRWRMPKVQFPEPDKLWRGDAQIGMRLSELADYYNEHKRAPRRRYWRGQTLRWYMTSPAFGTFEQGIARESTASGAPILVCFVYYPDRVLYPVPPSIVVIGAKNWDPDAAEFESLVTDAVRLLKQVRG